MANSYSILANLPDEDEKPKKKKSGYSVLANLPDDGEVAVVEQPPAITSDGLPSDYPRHQEGESTGDWWRKELSALTRPENWKRQGRLALRSAIEGIEGLPLMAADVGVATRNLVMGDNYQLPSDMNSESMNTFLPQAETTQEKAAGFIESVLAGSRVPAPQIKNGAPAGFISPKASPKDAVLEAAQKEGFTVPPASASDSVTAKVAESIAGKASTAQAASAKNMEVFNGLARRALGMKADEAITPDALNAIRAKAGEVYKAIGNAGEIVADSQYIDDLAKLGQSADEIAQAFPGANVGASKQIQELSDSLLQSKFDSKAALQYLKELRKMASGNMSGMNATDPAKKALGMAQREAAATLEDLIGRHLERSGKGEVAKLFSEARKKIAITYSVEDALNETTGNVIGAKLGQQMAKGKPLSNELELAAQFARTFPKASKEITESIPGASPLDWAMAAMGASATGDLYGLTAGLVRPATRGIILSKPAQQMLAAPSTPYVAPDVLGLAPSAAIQVQQ